MRNITLIAANELRRLFKSPLAWIILAVIQFLLAIFFYLLLAQYLLTQDAGGLTETVVAGFLQIAGVLLLLVSPLLTMGLIAEERRTDTIKLLYSSPVSLTELVLGKYIGVGTFYGLVLLMASFMLLSLQLGTRLDWGQVLSGLLGLLLLMSSFSAIGLFISSLAQRSATAAVGTFGTLFLLWIMNIAGANTSERTADIFAYISLLNHYNSLLKGVFNSADVIYYILVSLFFIVLTIWRLDAERIHG